MISRIFDKNKSFLDVGCGNGFFLSAVKNNFNFKQLKGIDFSKKEVEEARKNNLDQGNLTKVAQKKILSHKGYQVSYK